MYILEINDDLSIIGTSPEDLLKVQNKKATILPIAGTRKMAFIHGLGNGRLKHEVLKTLDRKYPKLKYQDASFKEYGYGATMVIIKALQPNKLYP